MMTQAALHFWWIAGAIVLTVGATIYVEVRLWRERQAMRAHPRMMAYRSALRRGQ